MDNRQHCYLPQGQSILIPFLCSALYELKSMTRQLDTLTTQMGKIQFTVGTLPTFPAMDNALSPIHSFIPDLSHRATAAPPLHPFLLCLLFLRLVQPHELGLHPPPKTCAPPPKTSNRGFDPDIHRYDPVARVFYCDPCAYMLGGSFGVRYSDS